MATFNAGAIEATLDLDVDPFQRGLAEARREGRRFGQEKFTAKVDVDAREARSDLAILRREFERVAKHYTAELEVRGLGDAVAEVVTLDAALAALGDNRTVVDVDTETAVRGVSRVRRGVMALIPALAILATGLIPLTAAAVPVLGLASNLTLAAGAAGVSILAFQGVGEALKAANQAGVAPTAENLEKLRQALEGLTPAGRAFVGTLQEMKAEAGALKDAAQNGLFPGLTRGLSNVELRDYVGLVYELADAAGDLAERGFGALDDTRWVRFFTFLKAEARPGLDGLGESAGNLAGMLAALWQAFDPLNDDFTAWLVRATEAGEEWAESLDGSDKFNEFIRYVREQGPEAAEALGAVAGAIVDIVVAAAPLGGVVLDVLQGVGEAVSFIAEQPFGPTLITGAAALYAFNRALALTELITKRMGVTQGGPGGGGILAGLGGKAGELRKQIPTLSQWGTVMYRAGQSAEHASAKTLAARDAVRQFSRQVAGGVAAAAGVALMGTGVADSMGVTNTAMLAVTGAMVGGVPGAIAGGLVGAFLDYRAAASSAKDATTAFGQAVGNEFTSFSQYSAAVQQLGTDVDALMAKTGRNRGGGIDSFGGFLRAAYTPAGFAQSVDQLNGGYATSAAGKAVARDAQAAADVKSYQHALEQLALAQGNAALTSGDLDAALQQAQPAMHALGISTQDMIDAADDGRVLELIGRIKDWQTQADSAAGRTDAFATTVADLGNEALSTADSAAAMDAALQALLAPTLGAEAATDAWRLSLQKLSKELKAGAGFKGFNEAAVANRQLTRDYVTTSMERLSALAKVSTTTEKDMAEAVAATRREFIESGIAAGFSRKEITKRADALGLTPKLVRTVFEAAGIDAADLRARELRKTYRSLPKGVRTDIRANGIPKTEGDVDRLVEKYQLTEKERRALVTLRDLASKPIGDVLAKLGIYDGKTAVASLVLQGASAVGNAISNALSGLNAFDGRVSRSTVVTDYIDNKGSRVNRWAGGPIIGPGGPTSDSIPAWLSNGEHVWTAREVANAGGHAAVEALREQFRYATGGRVALEQRRSSAAASLRSVVTSSGAARSSADIDRLVQAIRDNRSAFVNVSSKEDLEAAMRALEAELRRL